MSIARHHAEWLALLDISGPFLALPVLARVFPQGLEGPDADVARELRLAYEEWLDNSGGLQADPAIHRTWVEWVLRRVLELPEEVLRARHALPAGEPWPAALVAEHGEELRPDFVIGEQGEGAKPRVLVVVVPPGQGLEKPMARAAWQASPATRMMTLLRRSEVRLGLLTNGEQWMLVDRPADENATTGFASWYARLWLDEPLTLRAFRSLLGARRLFGVPDDETLETLLAQSASDQQEVTDQLGYQVRRAVELLVQALDLADQNEGCRLLREVPEERLYEASLTVMMRLVFLLFAEEQNLLLLGDDVYDRHYAASTLLGALREEADRVGEEVLERRHDAWGRLLAIFRAVYGGFRHDRLTMPAYGGSLFDPDRFPFLEGRSEETSWLDTPADPPQISNRTVLHLLEALQVLRVKVRDGSPTEARRLSFRALDIEQIGHVYEGLLDHAAVRAKEPILGLAGTREQEPEIPLAELEREAQKGEEHFLAYLRERTSRSLSALKKAYAAAPDAWRAAQLRGACGNDAGLYARVLPLAGLVRDDDYGRPTVVPAGSVYVTAGAERRATGTHYTPRSLTEPIVEHTLEPLVYHGPAEGLPREEWKLHPAAKLLQLTVCDMAMGSGAFLVQACRYLSERLLDAWKAAEEAKEGERRLITSEGFPTLDPDEAVPADPAERLVFARRLVADRCLYGVDKNPLAVEMAKLSLWLITLAKGRPFSFLDHALRAGDSLLGISDLEQLQFWALSEKDRNHRLDWVTGPITKALSVAFPYRHDIRLQPTLDARDADQKRDKLVKAEHAMRLVRLGTDLLVAAALAPDPKSREERRGRFLSRYAMLLRAADEGRDTAALEAELRADAEALLQGRRPFHWPLEFPEVFEPSLGERPIEQLLADAEAGTLSAEATSPGFSAVLGNPPFLGGKRISTVHGGQYEKYLKTVLTNKRGGADLCAFFLLRGCNLVSSTGCLGILATNTIAQGDTREVGMDEVVKKGFMIYRAVPSRKWPGSANLEVAHLWFYRGAWNGTFILDDDAVKGITPLLTVVGSVEGNPYRLATNSGKAFVGTYVLGAGFLLSPEEVQGLMKQNPQNGDVLFPYINGEDLNSRPDQSASRWIINFHDWSFDQAKQYPVCLEILTEKVKPERDAIIARGGQVHEYDYWKFWDKRLDKYELISKMTRVLVIPETTKFCAFSYCPTNIVFSHMVKIIALATTGIFALLSSTIHEAWARTYSSTLESRLKYNPSDCFETFPFPWNATSRSEVQHSLDTIGERYHEHRRQIMLARHEGLTKTYNRFHDPKERSEDIAELRRLHVEMDNAVAAAYGWGDLELGHGFHETKQGLRYTISEAARREVLDRLLRLNHERYAEEVAAGLHEKKAGSRKRDPGSGKGGKGKQGGAVGTTSAEPRARGPRPAPAPQLALDLNDTALDEAPQAQPAAPGQVDLFGGATDSVSAPDPGSGIPDPGSRSSDTFARLRALLEQRGSLNNGDVQAALGVDGETARALLRRLVDEGLATVEGQKRGTRYVRRG